MSNKINLNSNSRDQVRNVATAGRDVHWMAAGSNRFQQIGWPKRFIEWIKTTKLGNYLFGESRTTQRMLHSTFVTVLRDGFDNNEFCAEDLSLIKEAAERVGLFPMDKNIDQSQLKDVVQSIAKQVFDQLFAGSKPTKASAKTFYEMHKNSLSPFITEEKINTFVIENPLLIPPLKILTKASTQTEPEKAPPEKQDASTGDEEQSLFDKGTSADDPASSLSQDAETQASPTPVSVADFNGGDDLVRGQSRDAGEQIQPEFKTDSTQTAEVNKASVGVGNTAPQMNDASMATEAVSYLSQEGQTESAEKADAFTDGHFLGLYKDAETQASPTPVSVADFNGGDDLIREQSRDAGEQIQPESKADATQTEGVSKASVGVGNTAPRMSDASMATEAVSYLSQEGQTESAAKADASENTEITGPMIDGMMEKMMKGSDVGSQTDLAVNTAPNPYPPTPNSPDESEKIKRCIEFMQEVTPYEGIQVKGYDNVLGQADGIWWIYGYFQGTTLGETTKLIIKAWDRCHDDFLKTRVAFDPSKSETFDPFLKAYVQMLRVNDWIEGYSEQNNIKYETKDPSHEGLAELSRLAKDAAITVRKYEEDVERIINEIKCRIQTNSKRPSALSDPNNRSRGTNPEKGLQPFCEIYSGGFSHDEALQLIREGDKVLKRILDGTMPLAVADDELQKREVAALTWKFMQMALNKNQGFHEGTFVIEDSDGKFFDFLFRKGGYQRTSSHYKGRGFQTHYGVDVKNGKLPAEKSTILFSQVPQYDPNGSSKTFLFMKPENYGMNELSDIIMHGVEYAQSLKVKAMGNGGDDLDSMRKERVPTATSKVFENILKQLKNLDSFQNEDFEKLSSEAKIWGIAYMRNYINILNVKLKEIKNLFETAALTSLILEFNQTIERYDHLDKRTGREVYLSMEDLNKEIDLLKKSEPNDSQSRDSASSYVVVNGSRDSTDETHKA